MNQNTENLSIEQIHKTLVTIWFALFVSQFFFILMLYFVEPGVFSLDFSKPFVDQNILLIGIFAVVGVLNFLFSFVLKQKFLADSVAKQDVTLVQTALVAGCALCESITLFGLMLALIATYQYFFLWMLLGILGMFFHFPLKKHLVNASAHKKIL